MLHLTDRTRSALASFARLPPVLGLVVVIGLATPVAAQETPSDEELARMMQEHAEKAMPGPEHEKLASLAGRWRIDLTMWPEPGSEPTTVTGGTVESEMILGGRFLRQTTRTEMYGMAVESIAILGFDRRNGLYNLMAMDTTGTYWVTATGEGVDESTILLSGTDWDGIVGGEQQYDFVLMWEDEDTLVTQIVFKDHIHTRGGPPHKMVETRATRLSR